MRTRRLPAVVAVVAALVLAGCAAPSPVVEGSHLTIGWVGSFTSSNATTLEGETPGNAAIASLTGVRFAEFDASGAIARHDGFGTVEVESEDPLRVTYTVRDGVRWSDGEPVDAADLLLAWAAHSGALDTVKPERAPDGSIANEEEVRRGVYFDRGDAGWALRKVTRTPAIGDDGRSLTLRFDQPVAELGLVFPRLVPAHVVMRHVLADPRLSAADAEERLVRAVHDRDRRTLAEVSAFWSGGFELADAPEDASLTLSNGPYAIESFAEDRVTLRANESFAWGPRPRVERVVVRFFDSVEKERAALLAGRIDAMQAEATPALLRDLPASVTTRIAPGAAYDHLDLTVRNGGPFDAASYRGDAAKALAVRRAFLATVPRTALLEELVAPLQPDAVTRDSFALPPGAPGYARAAEAAGVPADADVARARSLLAGAGISGRVVVRLLYPAGDARRRAEFQAIAASAAKAGFEVVDASASDWLDVLGEGSYDAALFSWEPSALTVASLASVLSSDGSRNLNGFADERVDALLASLAAEHDARKREPLLAELDARLAAEAYGVPLFPLPVAALSRGAVDGVRPAPLPPFLLSGYARWTPVAPTSR